LASQSKRALDPFSFSEKDNKTVHFYNCTCKLLVKILYSIFLNQPEPIGLFLLLRTAIRTRHLVAMGCNYASSNDTQRAAALTLLEAGQESIISNDTI